ncbi:hypothetical protein BN2497_5299 [Janthinobacterium sp. CG23_2]|nr:hypothetical protein BN2497_5299 [Janthinobacterium sp. CG23_2]CUU29047.1 hypothetical protein BN3177_5299 [Janthinobacterium sp. CG23_2]
MSPHRFAPRCTEGRAHPGMRIDYSILVCGNRTNGAVQQHFHAAKASYNTRKITYNRGLTSDSKHCTTTADCKNCKIGSAPVLRVIPGAACANRQPIHC